MAAATLAATLGRVGDHCLFGLEQHCKIKKKNSVENTKQKQGSILQHCCVTETHEFRGLSAQGLLAHRPDQSSRYRAANSCFL